MTGLPMNGLGYAWWKDTCGGTMAYPTCKRGGRRHDSNGGPARPPCAAC